ncbi:MAG: pectate lyase, partial [Prevotella sp.]|nr:pectate lyase [Prevotella sp.]
MKRHSILTILFCFVTLTIMSQNRQNPMRTTDPQFFKTHEARRIGDQLLLYQRITGGWPKNIDMARELNEEERAKVMNDKNRKDDSTIDNNATTMQMKFLARLYQATKEKRYREGFNKAVEYLLSGQYENGGWPQFWPDMHGYQVHITFNDDAMVNTMLLLRDIAQQKSPYEGKLTDKNMHKRAMTAFDKGVECILATQIHVDGQPTVWCQQHDRETYQPAKARAYELPSF